MPEKCHVIGCDRPAVAKGLCDTHRKRVARHGDVSAARPADWGERSAHPAYKSWHNLVRYHRHDAPKAWLDDFWVFAAETPTHPGGDARMHRPDKSKPWGPDNFYWKTSRISAEARATKAAYMREWQRQARAANPSYGRNSFLRRKYGVSPEWYDEKLAAQDGVCAICAQPETATIKGQPVALAVDHDHETGAARGLLCMACNRGLGLFGDAPDRLKSALDYLDAHGKAG